MARRRRFSPRWALLVALMLGAAWATYRMFDRFADLGPGLAANQLLLPILSLLLVVMVLALAGVLIRNLVKLISDRKQGILGARLRSKLVFFFLALVLMPAIVLFAGSAQLIKKTVEAILRTPLEDLTRQSGELVAEWRVYFEEQGLHKSNALGLELAASGVLKQGGAALEGELDRWQSHHDLNVIRVVIGGEMKGEVLHFADDISDPLLADELKRLVAEIAEDVSRRGESASRVAQLGDGLLAHAATPHPELGQGSGGEPVVVAVGFVLPTRLAGNLEGFNAANQAYRQFRAQRKDLLRLYLTQIALVFVVTVFIATWIGFYTSRRITEPIQEVADAAREISAGNLQIRVTSVVGDEVGMLVDAFNEMAGELEESREVITRSTADLRRSNRELDERRRYIETLLENLSTGVVSLDVRGRVTTANAAFRSILGIGVEIGDDLLRRLREQSLEPLADLLDLALAEGNATSNRDLTLQLATGTVHLAAQATPLESAMGPRAGTLVMVEDLTDLMRAQRASAWREVARRIAHEIKNPLTPIQLSAQRLRKKFAEGAADFDQVLPEATASIEREVAALKQLVDEFSRFARMPEVSPRAVPFREIVDSVFALYEGLPEIVWRIEVDPEIGEVVIDPQQFRRVLINLVDNAVAALGGEGEISIRATPGGEDQLRIEVADTGPGIPNADKDKMFVPYFSTKKRGTGLGLAIVHKVVTDHGGTIAVEDNVPRGARFVIEIPA